ncbi:DUF4831 family protein [Labilibaculum antarcticum]|uniref:DUF4831 domain-containing protein n=1 Tax=Labilibaculum antarcticum TaxID=1717717 RepID=A0A1Y1CFU0_9BACT|nr:DUF4831 family protein [Labilibaculum antarcticum]BAX79246.1 DUF4831 domain-containing protein [Labilibaculum antarcticum]
MNRMILRPLLVLLVVIFCQWNTSAQKRRTLETPSTVVYALPQTVVKLNVTAEKIVLKRGPFADYAKKYLNISDVVTADGVEWELKSIDVSTHGEVDPEQYHKITTSVDYEPSLISLTPAGLIRGFNLDKKMMLKEEKELVFITDDKINIEYGEFSIDPVIKYKEDTVFKVLETDTAFVKVPVLEKQALAKTIEEKAEEAAHQIFKLRKRRFKILTANYEVLPPDGMAYEIIIKELEKLENDYVSLFIGKKVGFLESFQFLYTPKNGENGGVIFRMSPQDGPVGVNDLGGRPIRVDFKNLEVTRELVIIPNVELIPQKQIFYRIPGMADVSILNGKEILFKNRMSIAQFGKIVSMPAEVLLNENYGIEFYPDLGSIKSVSK